MQEIWVKCDGYMKQKERGEKQDEGREKVAVHSLSFKQDMCVVTVTLCGWGEFSYNERAQKVGFLHLSSLKIAGHDLTVRPWIAFISPDGQLQPIMWMALNKTF